MKIKYLIAAKGSVLDALSDRDTIYSTFQEDIKLIEKYSRTSLAGALERAKLVLKSDPAPVFLYKVTEYSGNFQMKPVIEVNRIIRTLDFRTLLIALLRFK